MTRIYFNERATIWDQTVAEKDGSKLKQMARRLRIEPKSGVLDVGSGSGIFIPYLLELLDQAGRLVALDFAEEMLKVAKRKDFDGNIEFLTGDVTDIPIYKETFNTVVCYSSFPHFHDKPKALKEMSRVMKTGGRLLICHTTSRARVNEIHHSIPAVKNDLLPDEDEMKTLLKAAGFTEISIEDEGKSYLASALKNQQLIKRPRLPATEAAFIQPVGQQLS